MENGIFSRLVQERKQERQKRGRKIIPPGPHFFILPIWEENGEEKMLNDVIYTNTLILLHSPTPSHFPNDIIVNLYKLYFPSSHFSLQPNKKKKKIIIPLFHPSNQTHMTKNQIFSILSLFHPLTNFSSSYFFTLSTKWTINDK